MITLFFFSMLLQEKPQQHQVKKQQLLHQVRLQATGKGVEEITPFELFVFEFLVFFVSLVCTVTQS